MYTYTTHNRFKSNNMNMPGKFSIILFTYMYYIHTFPVHVLCLVIPMHTALVHVYGYGITQNSKNSGKFWDFRKTREFPENLGISENVGENFRDFGENFFSEFRKFQNCRKLFLQISCFL
jgi:hypothetical protein